MLKHKSTPKHQGDRILKVSLCCWKKARKTGKGGPHISGQGRTREKTNDESDDSPLTRVSPDVSTVRQVGKKRDKMVSALKQLKNLQDKHNATNTCKKQQ